MVETSAPQRQGLQELEEALLLQAEMQALLASAVGLQLTSECLQDRVQQILRS